jgi:pimeloyl-ACP methyl ester carboxylesterase
LTPHLRAPVLAVDLPGRGAHPAELSGLTTAAFADSVVADLDGFDDAERVVLVGHSMAGVTIPLVAARRPERVSALVFVSCFVPREGSSIADDMPAGIRVVTRLLSLRQTREPAKPNARIARYMFCNDMDAEQTAFTLSRHVPEASSIFSERVSRKDLPPAEEIPRTYVKLLRDRALRPGLQNKFMANIGHCQVRTINSGHDAMISHPVELAAILNAIQQPSAPAT